MIIPLLDEVIDLIYEGITTSFTWNIYNPIIKRSNWPDLRRDYDNKTIFCVLILCFPDEVIDLIYEGITTPLSLQSFYNL